MHAVLSAVALPLSYRPLATDAHTRGIRAGRAGAHQAGLTSPHRCGMPLSITIGALRQSFSPPIAPERRSYNKSERAKENAPGVSRGVRIPREVGATDLPNQRSVAIVRGERDLSAAIGPQRAMHVEILCVHRNLFPFLAIPDREGRGLYARVFGCARIGSRHEPLARPSTASRVNG